MQLLKKSPEKSIARYDWDPFGGFGGDLFRWSPFSLLRTMTDQFLEPRTEVRTWMPPLEMHEKDGNLIICADLPGLDAKDVKVEFSDDVLTIEGERKKEHEETGEGYHRSERSFGHFFRSVRLPDGAQPEMAKAEFKNGVLEVKLPMIERKQNRKEIPVMAAPMKPVEPVTEKK